MSDRSALQLYIYAMPAEDQAAMQLGSTTTVLSRTTTPAAASCSGCAT
ncbi:hypothetical protein ACH4PR_40780 [Streptomyces mirabilis]